jgi:hypothetical protein
MAGAFGYVKYPQQKAPDPRELGLALLRMGQQQAPALGMDPMQPPPDGSMGPRRLWPGRVA